MDSANTHPGDWDLGRRIAFRFAFAYYVLYVFPFPVNMTPGLEPLNKLYDGLWESVIPWVGKHLLRLDTDITVFPNCR